MGELTQEQEAQALEIAQNMHTMVREMKDGLRRMNGSVRRMNHGHTYTCYCAKRERVSNTVDIFGPGRAQLTAKARSCAV